MILCTQCGHTNLDDAKHCASCTAVLPEMASCPSCQASISVDAWFCAHCGTSLRSTADISSTVDPLAPTNIAGIAMTSDKPPIPPTEVVGAAVPTASAPNEIPATEVVNAVPTVHPPEDLLPSEVAATEVVNPVAVRQPPDLLADQGAEVPPPPPINNDPSAEFTTFPDTGSFGTPDIASDSESPPEMDSVANLPPTPPAPIEPPMMPVAEPATAELEKPVEPATAEPEMSSPPPATVDDLPPTPSLPADFPVGATQLQQPTARFVHVYSDVAVPIPSHLHVVHIGKPNDRVPPDIDVSGFADSDVASRVHADLRLEADAYFLEDTGSANGTYVNNQALRPGDRYRLRTGDRISLGKEDKVSFIFYGS
ncbi:MAG: FHA domain-containing protein [Thermosynechococcaceae cyanobacterium]